MAPFRDAAGGLAQMQAPPGTLISFATQPRSVALDGDDGHSPYTLRPARRHATTRGYGLFRYFQREWGLAVEKATHGQQLPWVAFVADRNQFLLRRQTCGASCTPDAGSSDAVDRCVWPALLSPSEHPGRRDLVTDCDRLAGYALLTATGAERACRELLFEQDQ